MRIPLGPRLRAALVLVLLSFCVVVTVPLDLPALFGPTEFAWASWCYAFAVPVLAIAWASGSRLNSALLWPIVAYLGWIALTAPFGVDARHSYQQLAMLLGIVSAAFAAAWVTSLDRRADGWAIGTLALMITLVQVLGLFHHIEVGLVRRITVYELPRGWSGYPELGLLASVQFGVLLSGFALAGSWTARVAALCLLALTLVEAAFLYARVAWVGLAAVGFTTPFLLGFRRAAKPMAAAAAMVALVVSLALGLNPAMRQLARGMVSGEFGGQGVVEGVQFDVATLDMRSSLWRRAGQMAGDRWAAGVGLGNFQRVFESQYHPEVNSDGRRGVHAHNVFLHAAAETGLMGALLLAVVWGYAGVSAFRRAWRTRTFAGMATAGLLVVLLVQSMGDYYSYSLTGPRGRLTFLIWLVLALALATRRAHGMAISNLQAPTARSRTTPQT